MTAQRLLNKSIVIVGGTSGLGLSAAQACAREGAAIVVVGRDGNKANPLVDQFGGRVQVVVGDATQAATAERAVQDAVNAYGGLDGLYHVAGGSGRSKGDGPAHAISDEGWSFTVQLNLDSLFYSNRAALRQFLRQGRGGAILNLASVLGFSPAPRYFATHAYAAAKAAVMGFTRSTAAYYAKDNIRINALAPALVETPMAQRAVEDEEIVRYIRRKQPLAGGRVGMTADVDDAVLYFLSDESRYVTGQVLAIDGGWSVSEGAGADDDSTGE